MALHASIRIYVKEKMMKKIGNINILDLRNATEASLAEISEVGNVNLVIHSRETASLVTRLKSGNLNATVELSPDATLRHAMGPQKITRDYFKGQASTFLIVMGPIVIAPDVVAEDLDAALDGLVVMGPLTYPEHLAGVIRAKGRMTMGPVAPYPPLARVKFGKLTLDEHYLRALDDGTELAVTGGLRVPQVLPNDLLEQKLQKLFVSGRIECHAENAQTIQARLVDGSGNVKVIPAGFELVKKPLLLDAILLSSLPAKKLYCTERVQVEGDVSASDLDEHLDDLVCEDMILCPTALKDILAKKCNFLETRIVLYEGELWLVDDKHELKASRFDYLEGKATLVVSGEMTLDPEIAPKMLADRLAKVHNLGLIRCTPEQMAAIDARLGMRDGELQDSTPPEKPEPDEEADGETKIGNANYLAL
jgi:hypothetical protein